MSTDDNHYTVYVSMQLDVHAPTPEDAEECADDAMDEIVFRGSPIADVRYAVIRYGETHPTREVTA